MPYAPPVARLYDHFIFDLDGTLVDSRVDLAAAVNHVLRAFQLPILPLTTVTGYIGEGARVLVQRSLGPDAQDRLEAGLRIFLEFYGAHLLDHTRAYPGIPDMLDGLRGRGITLSVLTNKPEAMSRAILDGLGLLHYFVAVIGGDTLPTRKPDPLGVSHLCTITNTSTDHVLLVGDSVIDLRTARAAGVAFCGVAWGLGLDGLREAGVEWVVMRPDELVELL
jgi:phosphoglycolate phosphatase